jgi:hypothetical protein
MITDEKQLDIALRQLESFKCLRRAMHLHLEESAPTLTATVVETYDHRIRQLQEEICDYLLRQRESELPSGPGDAPEHVGQEVVATER